VKLEDGLERVRSNEYIRMKVRSGECGREGEEIETEPEKAKSLSDRKRGMTEYKCVHTKYLCAMLKFTLSQGTELYFSLDTFDYAGNRTEMLQ